MAVREFEKNKKETVRIIAKQYQGLEIVDMRVWTKTRSGDVIPTRKGLAINIDQVPDLINALEWALLQPSSEVPEDEPEIERARTDLDALATQTHSVLKQHGTAVHWDTIVRMSLDNAEMKNFTKWDVHHVLATYWHLFRLSGDGCFSAI